MCPASANADCTVLLQVGQVKPPVVGGLICDFSARFVALINIPTPMTVPFALYGRANDKPEVHCAFVDSCIIGSKDHDHDGIVCGYPDPGNAEREP